MHLRHFHQFHANYAFYSRSEVSYNRCAWFHKDSVGPAVKEVQTSHMTRILKRQLKPIEAASYSDYHWVRWRMLPTNLSKAAGGVLYYQFNIGNWLGEYYLDIVLWRATDLKLKYQGGYLTIFFVLCTGQGSLVFFWWCDGKYCGIYITLEIEFEHTIEKKCESQHTYMPYRQRLTLV